jgi:hypothetical protein
MAEDTIGPKKIFTKKRVGSGLGATLIAAASIYIANHQAPSPTSLNQPLVYDIEAKQAIEKQIANLKYDMNKNFDDLKEMIKQQHEETLARFDRQSNFYQSQFKEAETRQARFDDRTINRIENIEASLLRSARNKN